MAKFHCVSLLRPQSFFSSSILSLAFYPSLCSKYQRKSFCLCFLALCKAEKLFLFCAAIDRREPLLFSQSFFAPRMRFWLSVSAKKYDTICISCGAFNLPNEGSVTAPGFLGHQYLGDLRAKSLQVPTAWVYHTLRRRSSCPNKWCKIIARLPAHVYMTTDRVHHPSYCAQFAYNHLREINSSTELWSCVCFGPFELKNVASARKTIEQQFSPLNWSGDAPSAAIINKSLSNLSNSLLRITVLCIQRLWDFHSNALVINEMVRWCQDCTVTP